MSELSELTAQRNDVMAELAGIEAEIPEGRNTILEAIKGQRWYFFRNNKYILMDKMTGLLWANLDYFDYNNGKRDKFGEIGGYTGWVLPTDYEMNTLAGGRTFPFQAGSNYRIKNIDYWNTQTGRTDLDSLNTSSQTSNYTLPCNRSLLTNNPTYAQDVDLNSKV